jgi:tetratricopeptide (TPR) repeat protein
VNMISRLEIERRHALHYLTVLGTACKLYDLGAEEAAESLELFDAEWPNIQAGQAWAAEHADSDDEAPDLCNIFAYSGGYLFFLRLPLEEQLRWSDAGLLAARRLRQRDEVAVHLGNLANAYLENGQTQRAIEFYEQQLLILGELGDAENEEITWNNLGLAYRNLGDLQRALAFHEQRLYSARAKSDRRVKASHWAEWGWFTAIWVKSHAPFNATRRIC